MNHFHYGHGITGYGPEEPELCLTVTCLAECVRRELDEVADGWSDQAHGERFHVERLKADRPVDGSEPVGYSGSWESIATAALNALECRDAADTASELAEGLRAARAEAPPYRGDRVLWGAELRRLLLDSRTYPMATDLSGHRRLYVWECGGGDAWYCLLSEHDAGYQPPPAAAGGGVVPCACRHCMDVVYWSPASGVAPYCGACADADCASRSRVDCDADRGDGDE